MGVEILTVVNVLAFHDLTPCSKVDTSAMNMDSAGSFTTLLYMYIVAHGATFQKTVYISYIDSLPCNRFDKTMHLNAVPGQLNSIHNLMSNFFSINFNTILPHKSRQSVLFSPSDFPGNILYIGLFLISHCTLHALPI